MDEKLRKTVGGYKLYAEMAVKDSDGNPIVKQFDDIKAVIPSHASELNKLVLSTDFNELESHVTSIERVIPAGASATNQLVTDSQLEAATGYSYSESTKTLTITLG